MQYDPSNPEQFHFSKSPNRFRNDNFSPGQSRGTNRVASYSTRKQPPPGRNLTSSFHTINNSISGSHAGMASMEMNSPLATLNKNYMVYPSNDMGATFADMKQYRNQPAPQYVMSMSTNINLGIVDGKAPKQQRKQPNAVSLKKGIATRGNLRRNRRGKKAQGGREYYAGNRQFQDSQTFSRINRDKITDSINKGMSLYSPNAVEEPEPYEYKAIDSQIGSLYNRRDYSVDRTHMRNQNNLASVVLTGGKVDSTISPNPRHPRLNESLMFKSTNSPANIGRNMFGKQSMVGGLMNSRGIASPLKDGRSIKLDPIDPAATKSPSKSF